MKTISLDAIEKVLDSINPIDYGGYGDYDTHYWAAQVKRDIRNALVEACEEDKNETNQ